MLVYPNGRAPFRPSLGSDTMVHTPGKTLQFLRNLCQFRTKKDLREIQLLESRFLGFGSLRRWRSLTRSIATDDEADVRACSLQFAFLDHHAVFGPLKTDAGGAPSRKAKW